MEKKLKAMNVAAKKGIKNGVKVAKKMKAEQDVTLEMIRDANRKGFELFQKIGPMIPEGENLVVVSIALQYLFANVLSMGKVNDDQAHTILMEFVGNVYALNHNRIVNMDKEAKK